MRNRTIMLCLATVCLILLGTTIIQLYGPSIELQAIRKISTTRDQTNKEITCIMFLKTHKCASSTIQNILMRFGYSNGLDFVLPLTNNYIGNPKIFDPSLIAPELTSPSRKYDIFTHHTRYNYTAMRSVMKNNCKFVTILRDPATLYESMFNYYHLEDLVKVSLNDVLKSEKNWKQLERRFLERTGINQMSWDLGYNNSETIDTFIAQIDKKFDLVMISEYMEASLVLLADLMNWPLENVMSLKLNSRPTKKSRQLTEDDRDVLMKLNSFDAELYDYFHELFRQKLIKYGKTNLIRKVNELQKLNTDLKSFCVEKANYKGYANTLGYDLRNSLNWTCVYATKAELPFTDEIREDQIQRFKTLKKLEMLLIDVKQ